MLRDILTILECAHVGYALAALLTWCGVAGGGEHYDWSFSDPITVVERVEVPAKTLPVFEWSEDLLKNGLPRSAKSVPSEPLYWEQESNPACGVCGSNWTSLEKYVAGKNWSLDSNRGHIRKRVVRFDHSLPVWTLKRGDQVIERHVGSLSPKYITERYNSAFYAAASEMRYGFDAGSIAITGEQRKLMDDLYTLIGEGKTPLGPFNGDQFRVNLNGITAWVPAKFAAIADRRGDVITLTFVTKPSGEWSIFSVPISNVTIDRSKMQVMAQTPISLANPVLRLRVDGEDVSKLDLSIQPLTDASYPVRGSWWTHPGPSTKASLIAHLQDGQHADKFDVAWLQTLSVAELESLHSDDHDGKLKYYIATRK